MSLRECDLVMKGGITSGVVYPGAIAQIAKAYRLRGVGGSSAGAIAACFAAAAEFRRQSGGGMEGFEEIEAAGRDLAGNLRSLFQPTPRLKPLFQLIETTMIGKRKSIIGTAFTLGKAILQGFWPIWLAVLVLLIAGVRQGLALGSPTFVVLTVLCSLFVGSALVLAWIGWLLFKELPRNNFGLCSGMKVGGLEGPAFCEWIAERIERIAGNLPDWAGAERPREAPLTIRDLKKHEIDLAAITTDLSSGRPYQLPLETTTHFFRRSEFAKLFPDHIVKYLCETGGPRGCFDTDPADMHDDFFKLPVGEDCPVLFVARLSLSFPGLIQAVPLWRPDYTLGSGKEAPLRRCLFSDGGISSNFPIHFFDSPLPSRPTFGISLGRYEEDRHRDHRIELPEKRQSSDGLPVQSVEGIGGFFSAVLNTAKDWQDTLQSRLPGYAERIVTVHLKDDTEGGLNLNMTDTTIRNLLGYGTEAGSLIVEKFDMTQHRFDRALAALPGMEETLEKLASGYEAKPEGKDGDRPDYEWVLTQFKPSRYASKITKAWREGPFLNLAQELARLGEKVNVLRKTGRSVRDGGLDGVDAEFRLIASADRVPERARGSHGEGAVSSASASDRTEA